MEAVSEDLEESDKDRELSSGRLLDDSRSVGEDTNNGPIPLNSLVGKKSQPVST